MGSVINFVLGQLAFLNVITSTATDSTCFGVNVERRNAHVGWGRLIVGIHAETGTNKRTC